MALITCPDCSKEVSDKAPACIGCGCPLPGPVAPLPPPSPPVITETFYCSNCGKQGKDGIISGSSRFCSEACVSSHQTKWHGLPPQISKPEDNRKEFNCTNCGNQSTGGYISSSNRFCSRSCMSDYQVRGRGLVPQAAKPEEKWRPSNRASFEARPKQYKYVRGVNCRNCFNYLGDDYKTVNNLTYCNNWCVENYKKNSTIALFVIIGVLAVLAWVFLTPSGWQFVYSRVPSSDKNQYVSADDPINAYTMAENSVKGMLKAPSNARFGGYTESNIVSTGAKRFKVNLYVDAQNSFGAMMREHFECNVEGIYATCRKK